jgi:hypothetical protein
MKRFASRTTLALGCLLLLSSTAQAQLFRAYVASYGNDANPCTVGLPCRLLPAALNAVQDGGEVWILDSANFNAGMLSVGKSVAIMAVPGQIGSIASVAGAPAITVADSSVNLKLRNVVILNNANNPGTHGITMPNGGRLTVEDSVIAVNGNGTAIDATNARVTVSGSTIRGSYHGIVMRGEGTASITDSRFSELSQYGVFGDGTASNAHTTMTVTNCSFDRLFVGIYAWTDNPTGSVKISIIRSSVTNSTYGVASQALGSGVAVATISNSMLAGNAYAFFQYGTGIMESLGNNLVRSTSSNNTDGTLTTASSL